MKSRRVGEKHFGGNTQHDRGKPIALTTSCRPTFARHDRTARVDCSPSTSARNFPDIRLARLQRDQSPITVSGDADTPILLASFNGSKNPSFIADPLPALCLQCP